MALEYYEPKTNESTGSNLEYLRLKEGSYRVRILPPKKPNGVWYVYDRKHFIKDKSGRAVKYPCYKYDSDKHCVLCEFQAFLQKNYSDNKEIQKLVSSLRTNTKILVNVVDLTDNKLKVLELPYSAFKEIVKFIEAKEDWGDILHPETGRDFKIERKGSGIYDTEYSVMPSPKQTPIPIEINNDDLPDLEELVNSFKNKFSELEFYNFIMENYEEFYDDFIDFQKANHISLPEMGDNPMSGNIDDLDDIDDDGEVEEI